MIFRPSQKLTKKIKAGKLAEMPLDDNPFADWSCHMFTADRAQHIILTNTASLYSCLMYGKGITDEGKFIDRALSTIRESMTVDGHKSIFQDHIAPAFASVNFGKALNRSIIGSMNNFIQHAEFVLVEQNMTPYQIGQMLNQTPMSALSAKGSSGYGYPREAFGELLAKYSTK